MTALTFGSLFAGIGGIDLAATWAGFEVVWQVEKDEWLHGILKRHWPNAERFGDVRTVGSNLRPVDVVAGGAPCQPFSDAGERRGADDDRHLWPEMLRIIRTVRPRAVRYSPDPNLGKTHKHDWWRRRRASDALPPPKKVRCESCEYKANVGDDRHAKI